jgi:signal transduction histidine kinase
MQEMNRTAATPGRAGLDGAGRRRVEAVVETLATLRSPGETVAEVAHDARNMVTALGLYCDLLEEPGVLAAPFSHYGNELRLVAAASRRLVEKLVTIDALQASPPTFPYSDLPGRAGLLGDARSGDRPQRRLPGLNQSDQDKPARPLCWDQMPAQPMESLAAELLATRNLLAAIAGPSIALTVDAEGGAQPVWLTGEDLTRVLVNLVKNAAEAMPGGGRIQLGLSERPAQQDSEPPSALRSHQETGRWLALIIEDNGPGMPSEALDEIFVSGYTSHGHSGGAKAGATSGSAAAHCGLGLAITRSIVEGAGGRIHALNRPQAGARFEIELPVRTR